MVIFVLFGNKCLDCTDTDIFIPFRSPNSLLDEAHDFQSQELAIHIFFHFFFSFPCHTFILF
jgi:hypothetical protein